MEPVRCTDRELFQLLALAHGTTKTGALGLLEQKSLKKLFLLLGLGLTRQLRFDY